MLGALLGSMAALCLDQKGFIRGRLLASLEGTLQNKPA